MSHRYSEYCNIKKHFKSKKIVKNFMLWRTKSVQWKVRQKYKHPTSFIYCVLFRVQAETSIINVNDKRTEIKVIGLRSYTEYKIRLRNVQTNSFSKFIPGRYLFIKFIK